MESINCKIVSWADIEAWTRKVVSDIQASGYVPDAVIGLTRGGWIPSRLICDRLLLKDLYAVKTEHWGVTATRDGQALLAHGLPVDVAGKNVLVVDDITDTGQSLRLATEHVLAGDPKGVKTATLLHIDHSTFVPDFYAKTVPRGEWTWFIFPWNYSEDLQSLIQKAIKDEAHAPETIRHLLAKHCSLHIDEEEIREHLGQLEASEKVVSENGRYKGRT